MLLAEMRNEFLVLPNKNWPSGNSPKGRHIRVSRALLLVVHHYVLHVVAFFILAHKRGRAHLSIHRNH